jgi:hypothetical protein
VSDLIETNFKDHTDLHALATEVTTALTVGKESLEKLKESTSGNWLSQAWNSSDINRKMVDSLESIHLLGKAQLSFQKITEGLIKESLSKQQIFAKQQEQLAMHQGELAEHSKEIGRLVSLTDQTDTVEKLDAKIFLLQATVANLEIEIEKIRIHKTILGAVMVICVTQFFLIAYFFAKRQFA